jgi:hypothetical protein
MSPEMQRIVEDYLARLRRSLRGVSPDIALEMEREIRAHIDDAVAARQAASVGDLLDVLDRLGPPEDYARDMALYLMVDRGYRDWSVPHMVRSTAFWALSTVAGAVVVLAFGAMYLSALGLVAVGAQRILAPELVLPMPQILPGLPGLVLVLGGLLALAGLTVMVRWFIGHYVASAQPHTLGAHEADSGWVRRTSRRILALAVAGLLVTVTAGLAAGVYRLGPAETMQLPDDYFGSWLGVVSLLGLAVLLLSPVLGLLWTAAVERGDEAS